MGNKERRMINLKLAKMWAQEHGVPLLSWDTQLRDSTNIKTDLLEREQCADNVPGLRRCQHGNMMCLRDGKHDFGAGRYFAPGLPAMITKNINVEQEEVNGKMCKMVSLSWLPEVKHDVIDKLRKGTLRPHSNGEAYQVPPPYSVNVEITKRDKTRTIVPIKALNDKKKGLFKDPVDGCVLRVKHHHIQIGFCFTDYKVQGITVEKDDKLVVVLNKQSSSIDVATMSVCLSRVTRIEQYFFWRRGFPIFSRFLINLAFQKVGIESRVTEGFQAIPKLGIFLIRFSF